MITSRSAYHLQAICFGLLATLASSELFAVTVDVSGVAWPASAEVITSTNTGDFSFTDDANSAPFHLTQTFQATSEFDANSLFVIYQGDAASNFSVGLTIFEVADVGAATLPELPSAGDILLDTTFTAPPEGSNTVMQLFLDSPITLPASAGTAGYAVRFTSDDEFRWRRTGSGAGSTYAFGAAYENGSVKNAGARDFSLAVSSEALPILTDVFAVQTGNLEDGSTWDTGVAPAQGFRYFIGSGFTGTATSTNFGGNELIVQSGGTLDLAVDGAVIDGLTVDVGGVLTESVNGDFAIGDINESPLPTLELNGTANFAASPGADLFVDVDLSGAGDLNFDSNGSGSELFLTEAGGHTGTIRFNGSGDTVILAEGEAFGTLEMNSTGLNEVFYDPLEILTDGTLIFNQPGLITHAATLGDRRLQGPDQLIANADVTVDLSATPVTNERRLLIANLLDGSANIIVNGTATDPTSGSITRNEFELGSSGEPSTATGLAIDTFSGTLTANDFVDVEIRHSLPDASFVINNNATLEMGHAEIFTELSVAIGDVQVNSGGRLVVGFEVDGRHNPYQFTVTDDGTRNGDLTLAAGATTVMQINGAAAGDFDTILAEGDVSLGGTLELLINPDGEASDFENDNSITINTYAPTLGDTFDLISLVPDTTTGDFDGNGSVGIEDYELWKSDFGSTESLAADGNGDGVVNAADYTIWRDNLGNVGALGSLTGTFSGIVVNDPGGVMAAAGLAFVLNYTATTVQLEVVSAGLGAAVPEPSSLALLFACCVSAGSRRRTR